MAALKNITEITMKCHKIYSSGTRVFKTRIQSCFIFLNIHNDVNFAFANRKLTFHCRTSYEIFKNLFFNSWQWNIQNEDIFVFRTFNSTQ